MKCKIPCVVLAYYNFDIIRETIEFLLRCGLFKIYVIENSSEYTIKEIKPYLLQLVDSGLVYKYVLMHKNVSNNAYEQFFDSNLFEDWNSEYLLVTDGDIIVKNAKREWLDEQLQILKNNPDVGCCGINLSSENLPVSVPFFSANTNPVFNCINWIPDSYGIHYDNYVEADTGVHLWLTSTTSFKKFLEWRKQKDYRFIDENLRFFYKEILKRRWVITKKIYGVHLIWTVYQNPEHPYTQLKINKPFNAVWKHFDYALYTVYSKDGRKTHYPYKAVKTILKNRLSFLKYIKRIFR